MDFNTMGSLAQALSEYNLFSCSCYMSYESLMSRKNLLIYSILEHCGVAVTERKKEKIEESDTFF